MGLGWLHAGVGGWGRSGALVTARASSSYSSDNLPFLPHGGGGGGGRVSGGLSEFEFDLQLLTLFTKQEAR